MSRLADLKGSTCVEKRAGGLRTGALPRPLKAFIGSIGAAWYRMFWSERRFNFQGREYRYFNRGYMLTWLTERGVEIPVVLRYLNACPGGRVLEVGNVLSHYFRVTHEIVDKCEKAPGVVNADAADYDPGKRYDLIVSISTIEHIGFDEEVGEPGKAGRAVKNLIRLLAPGGRMVATVPIGYNPEIDELLTGEWREMADTRYLRKTSWRNDWEEVDSQGAFRAAERAPYFWLNAIAVLVFSGSGCTDREEV